MRIDQVEFPLAQPASPFKRGIKIALGTLLVPLLPARVRRIERGELGARLSTLDRVLIAARLHHHQRHGTMERLAPLHEWLWRSEQAVSFHEQAEARFQTWFLGHHAEIGPLLRELCAGGRYRTLCEIGCGSGLALDWLAAQLPQLETLIGLDLSATQTERNRQRYQNPRLRFEHGEGLAWAREHAAPGRIWFTNAGVLEYFAPAQLDALFATVAAQPPCAVALIEPVAVDFDPARETQSRAHGREQTWSHPYARRLSAAGYTIRAERSVRVADHYWVIVVADQA